MTFWGVEVKPGKPFTLKFEDLAGKLILTQATLGVGSSAKKSILQCNVGDKSPVFLCSLLPDKSECCALNLEFEEDEDVKFSVVGPTSIHLSGFIHGDPQDSDEDGYRYDSYGEDIAGTESEESDYDSDEDSEDDFIDDDDDMTMYPPSPVRNSGVVIEEIEDDEKASGENGTTKHSKKKKNQLPDSNNDQKALVVKGNTGATVLESEDEDGFPVSSSRKNEPSSEKCDTKTEGEQGKKNKKKNDAKDDDDARNLKRKIDAMDQDEPKRVADDKTALAGAAEVVSDEVMSKKKKKKGKTSEAGATQVETVAKSKDTNNTGAFKSENAQSPIGNSDDADVVNGDISENKKKKKKKKKKAKTDNGEADANTGKDAGAEAKKTPTTDERAKQSKAKPAKVRTYPNGFVIEELQMGKPNGKRASRGSKVSVRYIGKLQKNGKQFDANIGRAPFKFRLGVGQVIKGWDVGVEGMRVGDKRRLIVPPSMGYGRDGAPPQIPPNAWLVFDVELVDVA